jgi:hypothetical protein
MFKVLIQAGQILFQVEDVAVLLFVSFLQWIFLWLPILPLVGTHAFAFGSHAARLPLLFLLVFAAVLPDQLLEVVLYGGQFCLHVLEKGLAGVAVGVERTLPLDLVGGSHLFVSERHSFGGEGNWDGGSPLRPDLLHALILKFISSIIPQTCERTL